MDDDSVIGCHYYDGIYVFCDPDIRQCRGPQAHITDVAPTLMAMLGSEIGAYMDGKVIKNAFSRDMLVKYQGGPSELPIRVEGKKELSEKEDSEITRRLSALGYMD
jgi:hypothetical protein